MTLMALWHSKHLGLTDTLALKALKVFYLATSWRLAHHIMQLHSQTALALPVNICLYSSLCHGSKWEEAELKFPEKFCFITIKLMIRFTINILPLFYLFHNMLKKRKKLSLWFWKQPHFCVKRLGLIGIQLIKEYRSTVNGLIKTI